MELDNQVKQALKELPPAERVVAIALKKIYQQIRKIYDDEQKEIYQNRLKYSQRSRDLEKASAIIINGKVLTQNDLAKSGEYFVEEQKSNIKSVLEQAAPIKEYWLVTLKNSNLKRLISEKDEEIFSRLIDIVPKVSTNTVQITLNFQAGIQVQTNSYTRVVELQNGMPIRYTGGKPNFIKNLSGGLAYQIFTDTTNEEEILSRFEIVTYLINDVIPYSLRYFLGEADDQDQNEQQDDENDQEEDDQEGEEEQEKGRKRKH